MIINDGDNEDSVQDDGKEEEEEKGGDNYGVKEDMTKEEGKDNMNNNVNNPPPFPSTQSFPFFLSSHPFPLPPFTSSRILSLLPLPPRLPTLKLDPT